MSFFRPGRLWRNYLWVYSIVDSRRSMSDLSAFETISMLTLSSIDSDASGASSADFESQFWKGIQDQGCRTTTRRSRRSLPLVKNGARVDDKSLEILPFTQYIKSRARATCTVWLGLSKLLGKFLSLKAFPAFKDVASMTPMTIATVKNQVSGVAKSFLADRVIAFKGRNGAFWK